MTRRRVGNAPLTDMEAIERAIESLDELFSPIIADHTDEFVHAQFKALLSLLRHSTVGLEDRLPTRNALSSELERAYEGRAQDSTWRSPDDAGIGEFLAEERAGTLGHADRMLASRVRNLLRALLDLDISTRR